MVEQDQQAVSPLMAWVHEMTRRRVFQVLAVYVAVGWGFTEIVAGVVEQVGAPPAIALVTTIAFIVGFPIVLLLAWVFDVRKDGLHRVPTRGRSQLILSLAMAVVIAATYAIFRYLPRNPDAQPALTAPVVLAVLPFRNLSPDPGLDFMGRAIAEDLLNGVAVIPGMRVKATFSSFAMADRPAEEFGKQLGVNRLLDGTFRQQDGTLRISVRLVDTATSDVVWTRVLTDSLSNIFQIQEQLAKDVASHFGLAHPASQRTTSRKIDPGVYQLFVQAREGMVNPWLDTENTIAKIRGILELEPNFPEALTMLGLLDTGRAWITEDRQAPWLKTGAAYTLKALDIDPDLAEAYAVLALNYALQYRWQDSRQMADRALDVAGSRPVNVIYTLAYNNLGHRDKTRKILEQLFDRDPLNPQVTRDLISNYVEDGDDRLALQMEQLIRERGDRYQRHYLATTYARTGDLETARELTALWASEQGFDAEEVDAILEAWTTGRSEALELATDNRLAAGQVPVGQAIWDYAMAGAPADKLFARVREAIPNGQFNQIALLHPAAARYRQDPRFVEIYAELGLVNYWQTVELPAFCKTENIPGLCE